VKKKSPTTELVIENVFIRSASVTNGDKREARVEFSGSWTEAIRDEMQWEQCPDHFGAVDLFGTLAVSEATLTPLMPIAKNGDMDAHKEVFKAQSVDGFNLVPLKDKGGELTGRELRFTLHSDQLHTPGLVGRYIRKLGRAPGTLVVTLANEEIQIELSEAGE